jgi:hypothetical protein
LNNLLKIADILEKEKKEKSSSGNSNISCNKPIDLYKISLALFKK